MEQVTPATVCGEGKTVLAHHVPSILPPMNLDEASNVTKIYSVGELRGSHSRLVVTARSTSTVIYHA